MSQGTEQEYMCKEEDASIIVKDVCKSFKVYLDKGSTFKEKLLFSNRRRYEERKVLNGLNFMVKKGEAIGLIGHNGCGKSTTLKLLTRIIYPDSGTITMKGRVSSLIELGAGFHPDLSGRENIYTNAAIFGLTKAEIDARVDDIIAFSELEEFIDNPVRTYSSGMYMRLAFAVAINVNADILLIDEILAVGDAAFQEKCFNRLKDIKSQGVTIVIVSHSLGQIEAICDRSIWIHEGNIREQGEPREIHRNYQKYVRKKRIEVEEKERARRKAAGEKKERNYGQEVSEEQKKIDAIRDNDDKIVSIVDVVTEDLEGTPRGIFTTGDAMKVHIYLKAYQPLEEFYINVGIGRFDGVVAQSIHMHAEGTKARSLSTSGEADFTMVIEDLSLLPNLYFMDVAVEDAEDHELDYSQRACRFETVSECIDEGVVYLKHHWE